MGVCERARERRSSRLTAISCVSVGAETSRDLLRLRARARASSPLLRAHRWRACYTRPAAACPSILHLSVAVSPHRRAAPSGRRRARHDRHARRVATLATSPRRHARQVLEYAEHTAFVVAGAPGVGGEGTGEGSGEGEGADTEEGQFAHALAHERREYLLDEFGGDVTTLYSSAVVTK